MDVEPTQIIEMRWVSAERRRIKEVSSILKLGIVKSVVAVAT